MTHRSPFQEKLLHFKLLASSILVSFLLLYLAITDMLFAEFPIWFTGFSILWIVYATIKSLNYFLDDPDDNDSDEENETPNENS